MSDMNRRWLLAKRPRGMVGPENFEWSEAPIPSVSQGEVLVRNLFLSFDPTQRGWMEDRPSYIPPVKIGQVMRAASVGQVVESKNPDFSVGDLVQGLFGWQDYHLATSSGPLVLTKVPDGIPPERMLSVLGLTGITAYFGLLELGEPKAGDTVLVSGAAGATGSVAAQIAKLKGCRVIGIAGGPTKVDWLLEQAKLDGAIDYKSEDVRTRIGELCPDGIDVYFDNVGGEILEAALDAIAERARVVLCGGISGYNDEKPRPGPNNLMNLVLKRARMEGFIVIDYISRSGEAIKQLAEWVDNGQIAVIEDIQEGLENAPRTLQRLFTGANLGKQLLKIAGASTTD
ncbi:MAG: NADP-dependent oxidoreductase [Myxococcota bacterium]